MTATLIVISPSKAPTVHGRTAAYLATLNVKERDRRKAVNAEHVRKYGRELYPEGGQYATFTLDKPGRKFTRVVMTVTGGQRSVHAFIDRAGKVYKPAGWKTPATGARFDLLDEDSYAALIAQCEFGGGYLYRRR